MSRTFAPLLVLLASTTSTTMAVSVHVDMATWDLLEVKSEELMTGAASMLKAGMTSCMVSEPQPDSPSCITDIIGSDQAIAALAWNPNTIQLGAPSFMEIASTTTATAHEQYGSISSALRDANPVRLYKSRKIRKRREAENKHEEQIMKRVEAGPDAKNMTKVEKEEFTAKSWEDEVQDIKRCAACCNGVENNAVPFFEREESRFNINLPGQRFDKRFTTVEIRSCHRNKLCSSSYGLNPKLSAWFPPNFTPVVKKLRRCVGAEYRYYARRKQCQTYCSQKNGMSAASNKRVSKARREDLAKKIQYSCYRKLDPILPGMLNIQKEGVSTISVSRQRLTISTPHGPNAIGLENQIKLFRNGEITSKNNDKYDGIDDHLDPAAAKAAKESAAEDAKNADGEDGNNSLLDESANEPTENFPLHFTGTLELWGADMGKISDKSPCWTGRKKNSLFPKCMRLDTGPDGMTQFNALTDGKVVGTKESTTKGIKKFYLRITVERPDRDHFRVSDAAQKGAVGLKGEDWKDYITSHTGAETTKTEHENLEGWNPMFEQLGGKHHALKAGTSLKAKKSERIQGFVLYLSCFDLMGMSESEYIKKYQEYETDKDKDGKLNLETDSKKLEDETEEKCSAAVETFVDAYFRTYNEAREPRSVGQQSTLASKLHATADTWKGILTASTGMITADNINLMVRCLFVKCLLYIYINIYI